MDTLAKNAVLVLYEEIKVFFLYWLCLQHVLAQSRGNINAGPEPAGEEIRGWGDFGERLHISGDSRVSICSGSFERRMDGRNRNANPIMFFHRLDSVGINCRCRQSHFSRDSSRKLTRSVSLCLQSFQLNLGMLYPGRRAKPKELEALNTRVFWATYTRQTKIYDKRSSARRVKLYLALL